MDLVILDGIHPLGYRETLETSLEISIISSPDLCKQITIIRETMYPDGRPTSFGILSRLLRMAKATIAEHSTCYPGERRYDLRLPCRPRELTRVREEAICVKAIETLNEEMTGTYSDLADFVFSAFRMTVSNRLIRVTIKRTKNVEALSVSPMEGVLVACPCR
jgi:hypothetical protein